MTFIDSIVYFFTVEGSTLKNVLVSIIEIVFVILLSYVVILVANKIAEKAIRRRSSGNREGKKVMTVLTLTKSIIRYIVYFLAAVAILSIIGLKNTVISVITTAGVGGIAVGIGARSFISDTINGFLILLDDEYSVGDLVKIKDYTGVVDSISIRTTKLILDNNAKVIIPNGNITEVINYSRTLYNEYIDFTLPIEADSELAGKLILETAEDYIRDNKVEPGKVRYLGVVSSTDLLKVLRLELFVEDRNRAEYSRDIRELSIRKLVDNGLYRKD